VTFAEFRASLDHDESPPGLAAALKALWLDGKQDWAAAHDVAQDIEGRDGALIHAYLHRKEGDRSNADYWYRRAGRAPVASSFEDEWTALVTDLLAAADG
jgi:hypothetical protein